MHRDTRIQHLGDDRERLGGGAAPPIHRSSLFTFADMAAFEAAFFGRSEQPLYTRVANPTTRILERKIADLEGTDDAIALASGMAAVSATILGLVAAGDHVVMASSAYGPTLGFARGLLRRLGVETTFLPAAEFERLEDALRDTTRLIYLESPASLTFEIVDIARAAATARRRGITTAIDNSWATPILQRPADLGVDVVLHSGTKYIAGHSDILLGLVAASGPPLARIRQTAIALGGALSPEDAFLAIRGLRTLPLRMRRHEETGLEVARWLERHPRVRRVLHPGLASFPDHALARRQMQGSSGLFSFELDGDPRRLADALEIFAIGVSWGGFESLVLPLRATLPRGPEDPRPDIPDGLVRLSIGLEDPRDLIADLEQALSSA